MCARWDEFVLQEPLKIVCVCRQMLLYSQEENGDCVSSEEDLFILWVQSSLFNRSSDKPQYSEQTRLYLMKIVEKEQWTGSEPALLSSW